MSRSGAVHLLQQNKHYIYGKRWNTICAASGTAGIELPGKWESAKPFESLPGPTPLPFIGNAWRFIAGGLDFVKIAKEMRDKYGDVVIMRGLVGFGDMVFIFSIQDIERVLRNEGHWPVRDGFQSVIQYRHVIRKDIYGDTYGLVNGQNDHWGSFRTIVNPILMQPRTMHQYIPHINDIANEFIERIKMIKSKNVDGEMPAGFIDELNKWAFESITAIALDTRLGCLDDKPSEKAQKAIENMTEIFRLLVKLDLMPTGKYHMKFNTRTWKKFIACEDYFTYMVLELIEQANERIKTDPNYSNKPEHDKSVFEKLVANDKKIAMVMIQDMLSAGIETTSNAIGGCLYFLSKSPDAQSKLREELKRLLPTKNTPITKGILDEAKYLRACIKETLRIAPATNGNVRRTTKQMVIGGYQFPAGVLVSLPHLYLSYGVDEFYSDPKAYKPERWLRDTNSENVNPFVSLPFGFGARSCIGKRFANMEIEVLLAKVVRNYILEWRQKDMTFKQGILYGLADPLKLKLTDISD